MSAGITKAYVPTLLGLAAVADASGLPMLSNQLCKAHDEALGVFSEVRPGTISATKALQVVAEAEAIWSDAQRAERAYGAARGEVAKRIARALDLLVVARALLSA